LSAPSNRFPNSENAESRFSKKWELWLLFPVPFPLEKLFAALALLLLNLPS